MNISHLGPSGQNVNAQARMHVSLKGRRHATMLLSLNMTLNIDLCFAAAPPAAAAAAAAAAAVVHL
jgi:hypothetical protein